MKNIFIYPFLMLCLSCVSSQKNTTYKEYFNNTVETKSLDLYRETHGSGAPVIFLHGLGGNLYMWRFMVKPLATDHRLILFDLKGSGKSPKPRDGKYSMFDQAELIFRFIIQNDLHDLTLVGHSFGGEVALLVSLKLIKQEPARLSKLILIDTVAYPQKLPCAVKMLRMPVLGALQLYLIPDKFKVRRMLKTIYFDDSKITSADVQAYAEPLSLPGAKYALRQTAKQLIPANIDELIAMYPQINVPTLIIWGGEDKIIPLKNGLRLHQAIKDSQMKIINYCGHDPQEEKPDEVIEAMRNFLGNKH